MAAFVVDTEPDLEFVGTHMGIGYRSAGNLGVVGSFCMLKGETAYMTML